MSRCDRQAIAADIVFDGAVTHRDSVVVIERSRIVALTPRSQVSALGEMLELPPGAWLAPGFIDVQVNGGGDVLFNAEPTADGISKIVRAHRKFGTTALLPTLITDTDDTIAAALSAVETMVAREPSVLGIHFEGPFLSPEKSGVHRPDLCRCPEPRHRRMFARLRDGVSLVTLAPEQVPPGFIAELVAAGVKVSLGHSMATYQQTRAAMAEGLTGFSHLFNAMRPLSSREPGPIAAALEVAERLLRTDRRRRTCRPGDASARATRRHRPSYARDRCDAASRRLQTGICSPRPTDHGSRWSVRHGAGHPRWFCDRYGNRGAQLRTGFAAAIGTGIGFRLD